jgi:hypothetical protein
MQVLAAAGAFLLIGAVGSATAAKYKVVVSDGPSRTVVDIRTEGRRVTSFALEARYHCPADKNRVGGGVLVGKAFGDDLRPKIPISESGRFSFKLGTKKNGLALKGIIVKRELRGSFFIRTDKHTDPFGLTCWTGRSQTNPWVNFVALKK